MAGRKPVYRDEVILKEFIESEDPILTTKEIAESFGYSSPGAYQRLVDLESDELIQSKKVGRSLAWWITDKGIEVYEGRQ